jgi:hypothetical protein
MRINWHKLSHYGWIEEAIMKKIKLGSKVKDKISGFNGIVVARCEYLYKPTEIGIESLQPKDNKPNDVVWVSESRLEPYRPTKVGI